MDGFFDFLSSGDFFGGGGIFDSLVSGYGQESAVAFEDILRRYASEGRGFTATINKVTDIWLDYQIWRDFGNSGTYQQFEQAFESGGQKAISHVREMIQSHGFMLQQLRAHKDKSESIAALLPEYEALGTALPDAELTKKAYQLLVSQFHEAKDPSPKAKELMKKLNVANDTLNQVPNRTAYEEALKNNLKAVEKWFSEIHSSKWEETVSAIRRKGQKALSYSEPSVEMPKTGFSKWFAELPPAGKGGVIFGTVAAVGLGAFALAHIADKKQKKSPTTNPKNNPSVWQESVTQRDKAPATHLSI